MKSNYTHIAILLDRSGSMTSIQNDIILGLKSFIDEQRKLTGECTISLCQFDNRYEVYADFIQLADFKELTLETYKPRGSTALIDSMVKIIDETGTRLAKMADDTRPEKVVIVTLTDGEENCSKEFKNIDLQARIKKQELDYKWQFVYIGANQDAFAVANNMNISNLGATMNFTADSFGVTTSFSKLSKSMTSYRSAAVGTTYNLDADDSRDETEIQTK